MNIKDLSPIFEGDPPKQKPNRHFVPPMGLDEAERFVEWFESTEYPTSWDENRYYFAQGVLTERRCGSARS